MLSRFFLSLVIFVVVVVENWAFVTDDVVTLELSPLPSGLVFCVVLFVCFIVVGCVCAKDQPEV